MNQKHLPPPRTRRSPLLLLGALFLSACGHPASEEECKEIIRGALRAELRSRFDDEELVKKELPRLEEESMDGLLPQCVGQRIRESQLECIRKSEKGGGAFDDCL